MRIIIVAIGTWGDVRPCVVLAQSLQMAGKKVLLMASEEFRQWVEARGVPFTALTINIQAMMESVSGENANLFNMMRLMNEVVAPSMVQVGKEIGAIVSEGDVLMIAETGQSLINGIAEKYHLRVIHLNPQPTVPTREFPLMNLPFLPETLPFRGTIYRMGGNLMRRAAWTTMGPRGNQIRTEQLGMPKQTWGKHHALLESTPYLLLVSRHVIPPPLDWPPQVRITGYIFDEDKAWQPPQPLLDFLAAGEKPIYIGFGSMADRKPEATTHLVLEAVKRSGKRAVLLTGWGGIGQPELPEDVFLLKYAPHYWLFPRMAAVIHHGGAGTTAAGLAAGVPSIIVPFFGDQFYWGQRVYQLGVGTKPMPRPRLTSEKLAAAIGEATTNRTMHQKAAELGHKISSEDGIGEAVKAVQEILQ